MLEPRSTEDEAKYSPSGMFQEPRGQMWNKFIYRTTAISFAELTTFTPKQTSIFDIVNREHKENEKLSGALGKLKDRYGSSIIARWFVPNKTKKKELNVLFEAR